MLILVLERCFTSGKKANQVVSVEIVKDAVKDAEKMQNKMALLMLNL